MADRRPGAGGIAPYSREPVEVERRSSSDLADVLERVLDKGVVVAGDIRIDLLRIELLTIRLRLLIASADKAREMGIDWWAADPYLSGEGSDSGEQNPQLEERLTRLEQMLGDGGNGRRGAIRQSSESEGRKPQPRARRDGDDRR